MALDPYCNHQSDAIAIPNNFLVGYDPEHQTVAEIWSKDSFLYAKMPWGEIHSGVTAHKILKIAVTDNRIILREVNNE